MYFDGSLKRGGGGTGVLFISLRGEQLKYVFQILFEVSNNEAEYKALLHGQHCARTNLNSTSSSTQVLSQGLQRTSNSVIPWLVG
jgi:ribonuclease HI